MEEKVNNQPNTPNMGLPLVFMYEGMIYSKEMDGRFHIFEPKEKRIPENSKGTITVAEARFIFANTTFISSIITLTNNPSIKI